MRGEREYEFAGVGVFVSEGDARFLTRTLASYGYERDQRLPEPSRSTFDALADRWFATS